MCLVHHLTMGALFGCQMSSKTARYRRKLFRRHRKHNSQTTWAFIKKSYKAKRQINWDSVLYPKYIVRARKRTTLNRVILRLRSGIMQWCWWCGLHNPPYYSDGYSKVKGTGSTHKSWVICQSCENKYQGVTYYFKEMKHKDAPIQWCHWCGYQETGTMPVHTLDGKGYFCAQCDFEGVMCAAPQFANGPIKARLKK